MNHMNTRFSYLYRDASNYKEYHEIIFSRGLRFEQLLPYLKDKMFFIPSELGLDDLQGDEWTIDDHIWHEIKDIRPTLDTQTVNIEATRLLEKFKIAYENGWNEYAVMKRKGIL